MKHLKDTQLISFGVLICLCGIMMSWYATRTDVPVQEPSQVEKQFWV